MSDEALVQEHLQGSPDAFDQLAVRYQAKLYRLAYQALGSREDAQDAVQEILLRLLRSLHTFAGQSRFSTWLYRVAHNTILDCIRRKRRWWDRVTLEPAAGLELVFQEEETPWYQQDAEQLIHQALSALPPAQRQLLELRDLQEMSNREAAAIVGVNEGALKARLHRARASLRRVLTSHGSVRIGSAS